MRTAKLSRSVSFGNGGVISTLRSIAKAIAGFFGLGGSVSGSVAKTQVITLPIYLPIPAPRVAINTAIPPPPVLYQAIPPSRVRLYMPVQP